MNMNRFILINTLVITSFVSAQTIQPPEMWTRIDRVLAWPAPTMIHQGLPLVKPRGVIINDAEDTLWVGDPGSASEPSRIVSFPIVAGTPGTPSIFFSDSSIMVRAKWVHPTQLNGGEVLLVADQGELDLDGHFTGVGAKVLIIPVNPNGSAGTPDVIWEGFPFVCPTGIVRVGDYALITDPCAGDPITHPEDPGVVFPGSVFFAVKFDGTEPPTTIHEGAPFTSMIGACLAVPGTVLVNDTDAGRIDPTGTGSRPGFSPPAGAEKFIFDILDAGSDPPTLGNLRRQPIFEEGPLKFQISGVTPESWMNIKLLDSSVFVDREKNIAPTKKVLFSGSDLTMRGEIEFNVASSTTLSSLIVRVTIENAFSETFEIPKDPEQSTMFVDNKHAGAY